MTNTEGTFFNLIMIIHGRLPTNIVSGRRLKAFPEGTKQGHLLLLLLFSIVLEVVARAARQENEMTSRLERKKYNCLCR